MVAGEKEWSNENTNRLPVKLLKPVKRESKSFFPGSGYD